MINGFEKETAPLSDKEQELLDPVVVRLKRAYGKDSAVTNYDLRRLTGMNDARVRKMINHIRQNDLVPCLVASSKGYYVADSEDELKDYEASLRGRAGAIMGICESIERQRIARYGGVQQGRLF